MQRQRIVTTGAIVMQTVEFQQGFETGINGGLYGGGCRFKLEHPVSEESIVAIIRNLCEIAQEGWLRDWRKLNRPRDNILSPKSSVYDEKQKQWFFFSREEKGGDCKCQRDGMFLSLSVHHGLNLVHKPLLPGEDRRLRAILHLQLAENIGDMPLDRFLAEHQLFGNGSV
jgi:hypothetical protein